MNLVDGSPIELDPHKRAASEGRYEILLELGACWHHESPIKMARLTLSFGHYLLSLQQRFTSHARRPAFSGTFVRKKNIYRMRYNLSYPKLPNEGRSLPKRESLG